MHEKVNNYKKSETSFFTLTLDPFFALFPIRIYLIRLNNRNTRMMREISLKLTVKTPERRR